MIFIIRKDLEDQGIATLEQLRRPWKQPDGRKPIVSVSSLGGTDHVWSSSIEEATATDDETHLDRYRQCRDHAGFH